MSVSMRKVTIFWSVAMGKHNEEVSKVHIVRAKEAIKKHALAIRHATQARMNMKWCVAVCFCWILMSM